MYMGLPRVDRPLDALLQLAPLREKPSEKEDLSRASWQVVCVCVFSLFSREQRERERVANRGFVACKCAPLLLARREKKKRGER